jgi:hypothetical protein
MLPCLFTVMVGVQFVPISISGWGLRELAVISLLGTHGIAPERALLFSVCFGFVLAVGSLPGALIMRWIAAGKAVGGRAASPSQIGRFETQWLAQMPTCPGNGSTLRMAADRPAASGSTWIRACYLLKRPIGRPPNEVGGSMPISAIRPRPGPSHAG